MKNYSMLATIFVLVATLAACGFETPEAPCDADCPECCHSGGTADPAWAVLTVEAQPRPWPTMIQLVLIGYDEDGKVVSEGGEWDLSTATFKLARHEACRYQGFQDPGSVKVMIRATPYVKDLDQWYSCAPSLYSLNELTVKLTRYTEAKQPPSGKRETILLQGKRSDGKFVQLPRAVDDNFCPGEEASLLIPASAFPCPPPPDCRVD